MFYWLICLVAYLLSGFLVYVFYWPTCLLTEWLSGWLDSWLAVFLARWLAKEEVTCANLVLTTKMHSLWNMVNWETLPST